jgi:hypothetical protein
MLGLFVRGAPAVLGFNVASSACVQAGRQGREAVPEDEREEVVDANLLFTMFCRCWERERRCSSKSAS